MIRSLSGRREDEELAQELRDKLEQLEAAGAAKEAAGAGLRVEEERPAAAAKEPAEKELREDEEQAVGTAAAKDAADRKLMTEAAATSKR
jgi:hypothetical protein